MCCHLELTLPAAFLDLLDDFDKLLSVQDTDLAGDWIREDPLCLRIVIQILQETQYLHLIVFAVLVLIQTAFIDDLSLSEDEKVIMDIEIYHEAFA